MITLESRIVYRGRIVLKTGLHIGSGRGNSSTDSAVVKGQDGEPYIPGSSLKGIIRSHLERILPSMGYNCCGLYKESQVNCLSVKKDLETKLKEIRESIDSEQAIIEFLNGNLCDTCKLFGSRFSASKVKITDGMILHTGFPPEIRDGVAIDRDSGTTAEGAKYDYEVVPAGSVFDFEMIAENLTNDEKEAINVAIEELKGGFIFLGGNTSRGLGKILLTDVQILEKDFTNQGGKENA